MTDDGTVRRQEPGGPAARPGPRRRPAVRARARARRPAGRPGFEPRRPRPRSERCRGDDSARRHLRAVRRAPPRPARHVRAARRSPGQPDRTGDRAVRAPPSAPRCDVHAGGLRRGRGGVQPQRGRGPRPGRSGAGRGPRRAERAPDRRGTPLDDRLPDGRRRRRRRAVDRTRAVRTPRPARSRTSCSTPRCSPASRRTSTASRFAGCSTGSVRTSPRARSTARLHQLEDAAGHPPGRLRHVGAVGRACGALLRRQFPGVVRARRAGPVPGVRGGVERPRGCPLRALRRRRCRSPITRRTRRTTARRSGSSS